MPVDLSQPIVGGVAGGPFAAAAGGQALASDAKMPPIHFTRGGPIIGGTPDGKGGYTGGAGPLTPDAFKQELAKFQQAGLLNSGQVQGLTNTAFDPNSEAFDFTNGGFVSKTTGQPAQAPPAYATATGATSGPSGSFGGGGGSVFGSGSGGGSAGRNVGTAPWGGGGGGGAGGGSAFAGMPSLSGVGAAGGGIDFNTPLSFRNPGASGPGIGTTSQGPNANFYGRPNSIFSGLPNNPTLGDVVGGITNRQEENRNAALGILGNARGEMASDPLRQGLNARTSDLLANPYSLDEATLNRIMGQQNQAIGNRAALQSQTSADRAAAMGVTRSGGQNTAQEAIQTNAAGAMNENERNLRVQQAVQNQQDIRSALGSALPVVSEGTQARNALDTTAVRDVLGTSSIYGDAFLSNLLMGGAAKQNVNKGPAGMTGGSAGMFNTGYGMA